MCLITGFMTRVIPLLAVLLAPGQWLRENPPGPEDGGGKMKLIKSVGFTDADLLPIWIRKVFP